jgi:hypothetical protein
MKLTFNSFKGELPTAAPHTLPDTHAQVAQNCYLSRGDLRGSRAAEPIDGSGVVRNGPTQSFIKMGGEWLQWHEDVDVVRGPIPDDQFDRYYVTGGGLPRFYFKADGSATVSNHLGIPAPDQRVGISTNAKDRTYIAYWEDNVAGSPTVHHKKTLNTVFSGDGANAELTLGNSVDNRIMRIYESSGSLYRYVGLFSYDADNDGNHTDPTPVDPIVDDGVGEFVDPYFANIYRPDLATEHADSFHDLIAVLSGTYTGEVIAPQIPEGESADSRVYVYTYVGIDGSEGPQSPPVSVDSYDGASLRVYVPVPDTSLNLTLIKKRVYRYAQGASSGEYLFVGEIGISETYLTDNIKTIDLPGGSLVSSAYDPPSAEMVGLVNLSNGVMAGFFGKTLCLCEPYKPSAWPVDYRLNVDYDIVAVAPIGNGAIVLTTGFPYMLSGAHPSGMSIDRLDIDQSCASKRSVATNGNAVLYASPDGVVAVSISGSVNLTKDIFTKRQWTALGPQNMLCEIHDGRYVVFYDEGSFVLEVGAAKSGIVFGDLRTSALFRDLESDTLYVASDEGTAAYESGEAQEYLWKSKLYKLPAAINFSAIRCSCNGEASVRIWGDGELRASIAITDGEIMRLPSGYRAKEYEVEFSGRGEVSQAEIVTSIAELKS